jgi:hypothetical protein
MDLKKMICWCCFLFSAFVLVINFRETAPRLLSWYLQPAEEFVEQKLDRSHQNYMIKVPSCAYQAKSIVVLGSGISYAETPLFYSMTRILGLVDFLQKTNTTSRWDLSQAPIVFSGGRTSKFTSKSEADVFAQFSSLLYGPEFEKFRVIKESESRTTFENALYTRMLLEGMHIPKKIALITNSFHMRRAQKTFQAQGFDVCPVPVFSNKMSSSHLFGFDNGVRSLTILHEYVGYVYYKLRGYF